MTGTGPGPHHSCMHFLTFIKQILKLKIRQSCSGNTVVCTNKNLLSSCIAFQSYRLITLTLLSFYFIFMKNLLLMCRLCQHFISLIKPQCLKSLMCVCVKCWINKTYSKSTLNCTCLALIMGTVRKVPYKSVHSLMVTMCVTWYNIKSACILPSCMHVSYDSHTEEQYLSKQQWLTVIHNAHGLCFLWGRKWTCTYFVQFRWMPVPEYLNGWHC